MTGEEKDYSVDTELDFSSGTIIGNMYLFKDASGSAQYGLVDNSNRQIISPSSTITTVSSGTQDINISASGIMVPVDVQARYLSTNTLYSSTNIIGSSTNTSSWTDISTYSDKTIAVYPTVASTLIIQITPTSGTANAYTIITDDNIPANTYTTKNLSSLAYYSRVQIISSADGTIDTWILGMS